MPFTEFKIQATKLGYSSKQQNCMPSIFIAGTMSFTSHNHFVFWKLKLSYQMALPTILFNSSHKCPMFVSGWNETLPKCRKSIMRNWNI